MMTRAEPADRSTRPFRFKRFLVQQQAAAMKVGFDGILLGAWADVRRVTRVLDVGTGTGLVALMLAQRTETSPPADQHPTRIDALEIDAAAAAEAAANVHASPWSQRITVTQTAFQKFSPTAVYDLVVCNPPFFSSGDRSRHPPRAIARHCDEISWDELCAKSSAIITQTGRLAVILPSQSLDGFQVTARRCRWFASRLTYVRPTPGKPPHRVLLELVRQPGPLQVDQLTLEQRRHCYTPAFRELTRDFYLSL